MIVPWLKHRLAVVRSRTLVGEILFTQLGYALVVGAVAIVSLWSGTNWIVRENVSELARQWIADLDSLGVGLYSDTGDDRYLRIEGYLAKFPEIAYVRYYDPEGRVVFMDTGSSDAPALPMLDDAQLRHLREMAPEESGAHLEEGSDQSLTRVSAVIQVASIESDDWVTASSLDNVATTREVVGFVELGLDYGRYDEQLWRHVTNASVALALSFLILALLGRVLLRRALQPLRDIQKPLEQLAEGDTELEIGASPHREIEAIASGLRNAVSRIKERDEHLSYLANHDNLTGLPNRYAFTGVVADLLEQGDGAVLFVDLDQFKYVNDTLGYRAGDDLLKQVAGRITSCVADAGVVARFGGDEFGVALSGATSEVSLDTAEAVMAALVELPFVHEGQSFNLTCSVGVAHVDQARAPTVDEMLAFADLACHKAKTDGRNRVRVYEPEAGEIDELKYDIGWAQKLKTALKTDQFVLFYQPIVQIESGEASHFEVLLRLKGEDGIHAPGAFLPAATRFGLLNDIDRWVIENAFRSLAWHRRQKPELRFTINMSGSAFAEGGLVEFVRGQFERNKLDPSAVIFEITEQVAVGNFSDASSQIQKLIELGCEFALDDFGTGYSSFTYLKELPMQYVKIDGQFVKNLNRSKVDQAMVRAIGDVARTLGKKTIAEFVENQASLNLLARLGIDYAQGYFVGKPGQKVELEGPVRRARVHGKKVS